MAIPVQVKYWWLSLRSLNRVALGGLGLGLALIAVVGHQYANHPEWLNAFELDRDDPSRPTPDPSLTDLSTAEMAELAEIDNLALLLNQLQPITADTLRDPPPANNDATPTDALALPQPALPGNAASAPSEVPASPFAAYLERTRFRVSDLLTPNATATSQNSSGSGLALGRQGLTPAGENGTNGQTTALSPLQQLLAAPNQSAAGGLGTSANAANVSDVSGQEGLSSGDRATPTPDTAPNPNPAAGLTPTPWMVEGSLPGVSQRFIRTTPEMSPPPGTTGYRMPPSLGNPSPAPGTSTGSGLPQPAPLNLNLSPTVTVPSAAPRPQASGVNTAQPPSLDSGYGVPSPRPEAAPFSVPRPPGSYTGGGYINTFSDPNGPGN